MYKNITGLKIDFLSGKSVFWIIAISFSALFFYLFSGTCFPFLVGFVLAYLCAPFVDSIHAKYINRTLICLMLAIFSVCIFIFAGVKLVPHIKGYLTLVTKNMPRYYDCFISFLNQTFSSINILEYKPEITSLKLEIQKYLDHKIYIFASIIGEVASKREAIINFFSFFVIMPISFFYFLRDWNSVRLFLYNCVPSRQKDIFLEASIIMRETFANFFRGQFYVVTILSIYYAALLWTIDVGNFIYLGILSGLFSFIPFIGAMFSCVLVLFVSVPTLTLMKLYIILATYFMGQFIEGYILSPKFVGKRTGLHPLWILFSFFAGAQLGGIIGVLTAIPLAAVIRNLIRFAMGKFKASQSYKQ